MKLIDKILTNPELKTPSLTTLSGNYTTRNLLVTVKKYERMLAPLKITGKRVALLVPAIQEFIPLVVTINKLGGTIIPLNWQFRESDLLNVLEFLEPHIIFSITQYTGFDFAELINGWAKGTGKRTVIYTSNDCQEWNLSSLNGKELELEPLTNHFICCTSGSTGAPKGMVFNEEVFDFSFDRLKEFYELKSTDTLLVYTSTSTIFGIKTMTVVIKSGANVVVPTEFDLPKIIHTMQRAKCNKIVTTPSVFKALHTFAKHLNPKVLENLEMVCLTGEKMPENLMDSFPTMKNCKFVAQYGISEVGAIANANLCKGEEYTLVKGIEAKVLDGELLVKTGATFSSYFHSQKLTEEAFEDGWFKTGDLVEFLEEKKFKIVGRKKDLIKKGGQQVIPSEVELTISSLDGLKGVTVLGMPHPVYGEQVVAYVVAKNLTSADIRSHCKGKISAYKIPDRVIFLDELPIRQGKVDKLKLKSMFNHM
ncbi:acyl--CoA ligase [Ureibacillus chungkukjangi]|uniref:class I adenylate-forming enzyme family protein n=1 Tax=Ureibacillus chungkukjangi TaxID=1202712 RepID=UPI00203E2CAC|nr:class I adenylate-forming enzyme family protein [Ureibacillus chungkukjangi]MCM3390378.1 acyl--CoA ligase [Ureibacillus chungkukjangi]